MIANHLRLSFFARPRFQRALAVIHGPGGAVAVFACAVQIVRSHERFSVADAGFVVSLLVVGAATVLRFASHGASGHVLAGAAARFGTGLVFAGGAMWSAAHLIKFVISG
jgi:hypothetical protein